MKVVTVGGEKGGGGKSTICVNLAAMHARRGFDVKLLNLDSQPTAQFWSSLRKDHEPPLPAVPCTALQGSKIHVEIRDEANRYDTVFIDTGGRDSVELRAALTVSDAVILPMEAKNFTAWTMDKLRDVILAASAVNPNLLVGVVLTRVLGSSKDREVGRMREFMADYPEMPLMNTVLVMRNAYDDAAGQGMCIEDMPTSGPGPRRDLKAYTEISNLYDEVFHASDH